jgi:NAD dependent epimerase/dehydratase family enzyme
MSWIHVADVCGIVRHCLTNETARDAYNATAPHPVTNREFTEELARAVKRPALAWVPPPALRLARGEFAKVITASQRVEPLRTVGIGYEFAFPRLREALADLEGNT